MSRLLRSAMTAACIGLMGLAAGLVLGACANRGAPPVVKIGLIAPFEGPSRSLGYSVLHAVRLRIQQWNDAGNVPRVELVALNDDGDPALAAILPDQLALDPDVLLVLGPPQGHTALASLPKLADHGLPTLSLAPLPDALPPGIAPFAGTGSRIAQALAASAPDATSTWQLPVTTPGIWLGDPLTLADLVKTRPDLVPAAGSVAAEEAFGIWAGDGAEGLVWAMAVPATLPTDFTSAYEQLAGAPPTPMAALAYAAADEALALLARHKSRPDLVQALVSVPLPPVQLFRRQGGACCVPLSDTP
ncbi:MAG: ABC transporter substrate-binding protein [Caldilineales bacterium]|nr:ABC transporter substrate-binding protein [Caldilineales bacterium]MCW5860767.1 amino acid ABC transporter substrate-binding protein [Caldilineales bacterium]